MEAPATRGRPAGSYLTGPHRVTGERPVLHPRELLARARAFVDQLPPSVVVLAVLLAVGAFVVASGVVVAELVDEVMDSEQPGQPDDRIVDWVRGVRTPALTTGFELVTRLADPWVVTAVVSAAVLVLAARRRVGLAVAVAGASVGTALVTSLVKEAVGRDRPPPIARLVDATGDAFPSGHASQAVACYGAIALAIAVAVPNRVVQAIAFATATIIAVLVGVSRVYLGVHWPSDVIGGWIIGFSWLVVAATALWSISKLRPRVNE